MTTQVYELKFNDGKQCRCIATEPATDEENMASIVAGFCGKVEGIEPMRRQSSSQSNEQKEARE